MKKGIILGALLLASVSSQAGMLICNKFSCQDAYAYDSQEVLDALAQMLSGGKKELVFCAADERTKECYQEPLRFLGRTNLMSVEFQIPFARIYQIQLEENALQLVLDYQIQTNRYYPICSPSNSTLSFSVSSQGDFVIDSPKFECQITGLGKTKMGMRFILDYLNLEKGQLGGRYQAAVREDILGGGSGYVLMQLSKERSIEMPRPLPGGKQVEELSGLKFENNMDLGSVDEYQEPWLSKNMYRGREGNTSYQNPYGSAGNSNFIDWDWDNVKEKWDNFTTKFMKVLYLEPLDD